MKAGDRVHVRHTTRQGGTFDYEAIIQGVAEEIAGEPYYFVTGCAYALPGAAISDSWQADEVKR